jgi:hypothetical protein
MDPLECNRCGEAIGEDTPICPQCGASIKPKFEEVGSGCALVAIALFVLAMLAAGILSMSESRQITQHIENRSH